MIFTPPSFLVGLMVLTWVGSSSPAVTTPKSDAVTVRGKVVMLSDALKSNGIAVKVDLEPISKQAVLLGEDGTITPLLSDEASRACSSTNGCAIVPWRFRAGGLPVSPTCKSEFPGRA